MFFAARFTLKKPKTPMSNVMNLRTSFFEDYRCAFYFIQFYIFTPVIHSHSGTVHKFYFTTIFSCVYTTRNIFLIPDDAVARNLIIIFNFSSQRPHLNYIFLSNVYSFDTMEFSMKHKY